MNDKMTPRELWIAVRRLLLSAIAILDRYYDVGQAHTIPVIDADDFQKSD